MGTPRNPADPPSDDARWQRVRTLFDRACALNDAARTQFLTRECGEDAWLRAELEALLAADQRAAERLGHVVRDAAGDVSADLGADTSSHEPVPFEGRRIGPWRLVRELGHGGMGTVYLAERVDGAFTQQVALKLVNRGMDSAQILQRFESERQILARLEHPSIARLVDGGLAADGSPWFAMELVEGDPIDRYCTAHALDVSARLKLFADVCKAVMFAHSRLVIHRDLKPDNIFITQRGEVRLLDFGIAKVLGDAMEGGTLTRTGMRVMTPGYASPEQVRGLPVGTETDVYSLGVILYELLTGTRPHDLQGKSLAEVERIVTESSPARPSTRVSHTGRLSKQLRGDLDVICLKALRHEPERRYGSVEALHEDIVRHLTGRPVLARPDTVRYRVRKFVGRHRGSVAASAAGLVLVATLTSVYLARLAEERDVARSEAAKAEAVADFLQGIFQVADPFESRGASVTARELLERGARRVEQELKAEPEVQARMMRVIGEVYASLGMTDEAIPLLEGALARHQALYGDLHEETASSTLALGIRKQDVGDLTGSEPLLRKALATRRALFPVPHAAVSEAERHLASWEETKGNDSAAESLMRGALAQDRLIYGADHERVVGTVVRLGGMLRRTGSRDEALPLLREGLAAQRRLFGDTHPSVASTMRNLASLRRDQGDLVEAESLYVQVLAIRRTLFGDTHPEVANVLNSYSILLEEKGDLHAAIAIQREAIAILEVLHAEPHPSLAAAYNNHAETLRLMGQFTDAIAVYRKCIAVQDAVLPAGHANRAYPLIGLGRVYRELGQFRDAERAFERALAVRRAALAPGSSRIAEVESLLADLRAGQTAGR